MRAIRGWLRRNAPEVALRVMFLTLVSLLIGMFAWGVSDLLLQSITPSGPAIKTYGEADSDWVVVRTAIRHEGYSYAVVEVVHDGTKYLVMRVDDSAVLLGSSPQFPEESD